VEHPNTADRMSNE